MSADDDLADIMMLVGIKAIALLEALVDVGRLDPVSAKLANVILDEWHKTCGTTRFISRQVTQ